jgi:hypothetical protein
MKIRKRTVVLAAVLLVVLLWAASFFSPEGAIRRYMFLHLHPVSAFTSKITDLGVHFAINGHLYHATDYVDRATGEEIPFFYVKKDGPFWYVSSAGSGP